MRMLGLHLELVSNGLFRVAAGSPESAVGSDSTLWATYCYLEKSTTHRTLALKINIRILDSHLLVLLSKSVKHQPLPSSTTKENVQLFKSENVRTEWRRWLNFCACFLVDINCIFAAAIDACTVQIGTLCAFSSLSPIPVRRLYCKECLNKEHYNFALNSNPSL